ncbi:MAG: hypothetical protein ORN83_05845 [Chthoniobacteraceae bacterium]|nr:hypothetical protein [Chthoniobacteraceae bacterium]
MKAVELRLSDTNSANDSSGKTWGLDGGLFWVMVAGGSFSVAVLLVLFSALHSGLTISIVVSLAPITVSLTYVFGFRQGKPAGYDIDLLDTCLNGSGLTPKTPPTLRHPLAPNDYVAH